MIKIFEGDRIPGYDDWLANQKTSEPRYDSDFDAAMSAEYDKAKELLAQAREEDLPVISFDSAYNCIDCKYGVRVIRDPDDDTDTHICHAEKCPYGVWKRKKDKYGNKWIEIQD